jgi:hypothetical protein
MEIKQLIEELQELVKKQNLQEKAIQYCKTALTNSKAEEIDLNLEPLNGYELGNIQLQFKKHSLIFKNNVLTYPYINTTIGLYLINKSRKSPNDLEEIGEYSLITLLDGEIDDDYLLFYDKQNKAL